MNEPSAPSRSFALGQRQARIFYTVLILDGLLVAAHLLLGQRVPFLNLDLENNLPALYSGLKLIMVGILAFVVYGSSFPTQVNVVRRKKWPWLVFGTMFIYLAMDEMFQLHENIADVLAPLGPAALGWYDNQVFYWTLIFLPFIVLGVSFLAYFIKILPRSGSTRGFLVAGLACFIGVIVAEVVGGFLGSPSVGYFVMTIEESLEFVGATLFLGGVLNVVARLDGERSIM